MHDIKHAHGAGRCTPISESARVASAGRIEDHGMADKCDLATMRARPAHRGCTLYELSDGYLVGRWRCSKAVPCLRSVGDLLRRIGGAA